MSKYLTRPPFLSLLALLPLVAVAYGVSDEGGGHIQSAYQGAKHMVTDYYPLEKILMCTSLTQKKSIAMTI